MKKLFFVCLACAALNIYAAIDTYTLTGHAAVLDATPTVADTLTAVEGAAFSLLPYKGYATVGVSIGGEASDGTNRVTIVSVQQAATSSGTWATLRAVTNNTSTASFTRIPFEVGKGGAWMRVTLSSTNANSAVSAFINAYRD